VRRTKSDLTTAQQRVERRGGEERLSLGERLQSPAFKAQFEDARSRSDLVLALIQARADAQLSQKSVAKEMATTQSAVSELEAGDTDPRLSTLQRYARAVGSQLMCFLARPETPRFTFSRVEASHVAVMNVYPGLTYGRAEYAITIESRPLEEDRAGLPASLVVTA
jgi:transcriptional regulator with XRE-family HTH domain